MPSETRNAATVASSSAVPIRPTRSIIGCMTRTERRAPMRPPFCPPPPGRDRPAPADGCRPRPRRRPPPSPTPRRPPRRPPPPRSSSAHSNGPAHPCQTKETRTHCAGSTRHMRLDDPPAEVVSTTPGETDSPGQRDASGETRTPTSFRTLGPEPSPADLLREARPHIRPDQHVRGASSTHGPDRAQTAPGLWAAAAGGAGSVLVCPCRGR
jgi:hypothetical protein